MADFLGVGPGLAIGQGWEGVDQRYGSSVTSASAKVSALGRKSNSSSALVAAAATAMISWRKEHASSALVAGNADTLFIAQKHTNNAGEVRASALIVASGFAAARGVPVLAALCGSVITAATKRTGSSVTSATCFSDYKALSSRGESITNSAKALLLIDGIKVSLLGAQSSAYALSDHLATKWCSSTPTVVSADAIVLADGSQPSVGVVILSSSAGGVIAARKHAHSDAVVLSPGMVASHAEKLASSHSSLALVCSMRSKGQKLAFGAPVVSSITAQPISHTASKSGHSVLISAPQYAVTGCKRVVQAARLRSSGIETVSWRTNRAVVFQSSALGKVLVGSGGKAARGPPAVTAIAVCIDDSYKRGMSPVESVAITASYISGTSLEVVREYIFAASVITTHISKRATITDGVSMKSHSCTQARLDSRLRIMEQVNSPLI